MFKWLLLLRITDKKIFNLTSVYVETKFKTNIFKLGFIYWVNNQWVNKNIFLRLKWICQSDSS